MLRRLHLILAALAMLFAPTAMQSGVAMAAMPKDHVAAAKDGHCGESTPDQNDKSGAMTQCCTAMCSAVAPLDLAMDDLVDHHAPVLTGLVATRHPPFLAKLPTPPPRRA